MLECARHVSLQVELVPPAQRVNQAPPVLSAPLGSLAERALLAQQVSLATKDQTDDVVQQVRTVRVTCT